VTETQPDQVLRKDFDTERMREMLPSIEDVGFWRALSPELAISDHPFETGEHIVALDPELRAAYCNQVRTEGYFQTQPLLPEGMREQMLEAIESVRRVGLPNMFALVYDVFFQALTQVGQALAGVLGEGWQLIPNFWVYYIEPSDDGKGFEPHRDAEYPDTLDEQGMPNVLTAWIAVTEATPLNSCMYLLPRNRDRQYDEATHKLKTGWNEIALQDLRALPAAAGTLSCWDQYVFHYGSRSCKRAPRPRVSIALYCQRGDVPAVDDHIIQVPSRLDFKTRLGIICRGLRRYSYVSFRDSPQGRPLLDFLDLHAL